MDKLVSKNPIQRFKQGKKIIKASGGLDTGTLNGRNVTKKDGIWVYDDINSPIAGMDYKKIITKTKTSEKKQDYSFMKGGTRTRTPEEQKKWEAEVQRQKNLMKNDPRKVINKRIITPRSKSPSFYGTRAGGQVKIRDKGFTGFGNLINDEQKQKLIGAGFQDNDFTNVTAFQKALNRYFAGDNAGSILEDGKWGNQTQKAFNLALSKANSPIVTTTKGIEIQPASIVPTYTSPAIPSTIPNLNLNTPTYVSANRSQTRDWMRSNNINPYSVTGDMRAAIRRIRAGQANDNDKLLVKNNEQLYNLLKGYYKQGGQLLSKNSVERFKNRINKN